MGVLAVGVAGLGLAGLVRRKTPDNPEVQASVNEWLRDGSGFFYSATDESPRDFYLYRYDNREWVRAAGPFATG